MTKRRSRTEPRAAERGFALVLAILSLMLLTFLGLTLATTTSTELQIATNYRWSQQALYNAEAGLEAARVVLANVASPTSEWMNQLPIRRTDLGGNPLLWNEGPGTGPWTAPTGPPATGDTITGSDFYKSTCDTRGGVGYGKVLTDRRVTPEVRYEDVSAFEGETLNGAFTIWVRRPLEVNDDGQYSDSEEHNAVVIVSEGRAPYTGAGTAFTAARQAVRVLETSFMLATDPENACTGNLAGQEGLSSTGENFNPCAKVNAAALQRSFGGAGAGSLGDLGGGTAVE